MATISGGAKLKEALKKIATGVGRGGTLRVGFLENATYPNGTPVAAIAAIHNYGAPRAGIPARPFFSNMIAAKSGEWPKAIASLLKANDYDAPTALTLTGHAIVGQLKRSIIETNSPALKPATIVRKGGTRGMVYDPKDKSTFPAKPLIRTAHMINSVDFEVV